VGCLLILRPHTSWLYCDAKAGMLVDKLLSVNLLTNNPVPCTCHCRQHRVECLPVHAPDDLHTVMSHAKGCLLPAVRSPLPTQWITIAHHQTIGLPAVRWRPLQAMNACPTTSCRTLSPDTSTAAQTAQLHTVLARSKPRTQAGLSHGCRINETAQAVSTVCKESQIRGPSLALKACVWQLLK
jgi:hypothetical protein